MDKALKKTARDAELQIKEVKRDLSRKGKNLDPQKIQAIEGELSSLRLGIDQGNSEDIVKGMERLKEKAWKYLGVKKRSIVREYIEAILIALVLAFTIRTFVIQAFKIPSGSMIPTLVVGDHILVNKFIYGTRIPFTDLLPFPLRRPKRGDVIVFKYPENPKIDFIKRIIGEPKEKVEIKDKEIFVNDMPIKDPWGEYENSSFLPKDFSNRDNFGPVVVPRDSYFVLGDNRDNSKDSRFWGFVDRKEILGKAILIYWSWDGKENDVRWRRLGKLIR